MFRTIHNYSKSRKGAVAVEFAIVAPVLVIIVLGVTRISHLLNVQNSLETAAREGARFGAMDRTGMLSDGVTSNSKMESDIKNYLKSQGFEKDDVSVKIYHSGTTNTFDLDDPTNNLKLFEVNVSLPYSAATGGSVNPNDDYNLEASVTFRNSRSNISE